MAKQTILIATSVQFTGLMASLGVELSKRYNVVFSAHEPNVAKIVKRICGDAPHQMEILTTTVAGYRVGDDVLEQGVAYEKKFGVPLARFCSYDRALGKGYLNNVDRHPDIIRAWWPMEDKYREVVKLLKYWEYVIDKHKPSLVLSFGRPPELDAAARASGATVLSLASCRFSNYWFFSDCNYYSSKIMADCIGESLEKATGDDKADFEFELDSRAAMVMPTKAPSYKLSLKEALVMAARETVSLIKGTRKKNSYRYLGWVPSRFRKVWAYNYLAKKGTRPEELKNVRKVLVALHMEPEVALMVHSPEFTNCMEMVVRLSKSLPADTVLVVKEHPICLGVRSKVYYDMLLRMPNVVIAHPELPTATWLDEVDAVSVITSTVGVEALFAQVPVISFGKHQMINMLPSVRFAEDLDSVREALLDVLDGGVGRDDLVRSRTAFINGQLAGGFAIPDIAKMTYKREYVPEQARVIVDNLMRQYGHVLDAADGDSVGA